MGRPSSFDDEIAATICERLAAGESLRAICSAEEMPDRGTVIRWVLSNEYFAAKYAQAREIQAELLVDEMQEIADDGTNDWVERTGRGGESLGWMVNGEAVARSKVRLEQRRWYAEKLLPKKYGVRQELKLTADAALADAIVAARQRSGA